MTPHVFAYVIGASLALTPALALPQDTIKVGLGALGCTDVLRITGSASKESQMMLVSWVQGYFAGMNTVQGALAPERGAKLIPDSDALLAYAVLLCKQSGSAKLIEVMTGLYPGLPDTRR